MIVLDASAALSALINAGVAREVVAGEQLHAPHLIDVEIASGLRRAAQRGAVTVDQARSMLGSWQALGVSRYSIAGLLERVWELRDNLSAYDAAYVALAEALGCGLVTADRRLSPGIRCPVTTVPS